MDRRKNGQSVARMAMAVALTGALLSCTTNPNQPPKTDSNSSMPTAEVGADAVADSIPLYVRCLMEAYPDHIIGYADNNIYWSDSTTMTYDDGLEKSAVERMDNADIEDMSLWVYPDAVEPFNDAGRIRSEAFFKKMYGSSRGEMNKHLTTIVWCPNLVGQRLQISTVNGVDKQLQKVSDELDLHPEWKAYISGPSTVNWRVVAGTNRLSPHSYGITIDMGVAQSNYWKWDHPKASETDTIDYRNKFPAELVAIFEKHGFIWGGRWYHYDNMHFEYRPEILLYRERMGSSRD